MQRRELPFDIGDERLAAAAWSRIVEPADSVAGSVIGELGPSEALAWLLSDPMTGAPPRLMRRVESWRVRLGTLDIRREMEMARRCGARVVIPGDTDWPAGLADLGAEAPVALWVRGELSGAGRAVALVGARAATRYGEHVAAEFGHAMAERGLAVISGGAYGIDAAAHRGALAAEGAARTVAVLAGGVDRPYPSGNADLQERIARRGAVISEVPPGSMPSKHRFLARNRLIAAMGRATVVIEASYRSGALSTANHASRLLRPVGAVPGAVTSAQSAGCHRLIREGQAVLVSSPDEVAELVTPAGAALPPDPLVAPGLLDGLPEDQARVLDALPVRAAVEVRKVAITAGMAADEVRGALGLLELAGKVRRSGTRWARA